jgi:hypothetical protein
MRASKNRLTLKAFANVSPGRGPHAGSPRGVGVFALKPWVKTSEEIVRNPEGGCVFLLLAHAPQLLQS